MKNKIRKKTLQAKVFVVQLLIRLRIIPNVWYKCELDLAEIRAQELAEFFGWE